MNRADFQDLADLRIAEAECLFQAGLFYGAYYLAVYAVEARLKTCIAKMINQYEFPPKNTQRDCYTHDFEILVKTAGLGTILTNERKVNRTLDRNWTIFISWKEDCRYETTGTKSQSIALDFLHAISDQPDGVLTWIKSRW